MPSSSNEACSDAAAHLSVRGQMWVVSESCLRKWVGSPTRAKSRREAHFVSPEEPALSVRARGEAAADGHRVAMAPRSLLAIACTIVGDFRAVRLRSGLRRALTVIARVDSASCSLEGSRRP